MDYSDDEAGSMNNIAMRHTIGNVQEGVWSGWRHWTVEEEDCESHGGEEDEDEEGGENDDEEEWEDEDEDDKFVGLSARDRLGDDFERDAIANGKSLLLCFAVYFNIYSF
jgi:hypothetical protein